MENIAREGCREVTMGHDRMIACHMKKLAILRYRFLYVLRSDPPQRAACHHRVHRALGACRCLCVGAGDARVPIFTVIDPTAV